MIWEIIKKWWRKEICDKVPPHLEDMFDEWDYKNK